MSGPLSALQRIRVQGSVVEVAVRPPGRQACLSLQEVFQDGLLVVRLVVQVGPLVGVVLVVADVRGVEVLEAGLGPGGGREAVQALQVGRAVVQGGGRGQAAGVDLLCVGGGRGVGGGGEGVGRGLEGPVGPARPGLGGRNE